MSYTINHIQINLENVKAERINPLTLMNRRMILRNGKRVGEPPKFREDIHQVCLDLKVNLKMVESIMEMIEEHKTNLTDEIYMCCCKGLKEHYEWHTEGIKHLTQKCICPCRNCLEDLDKLIGKNPFVNTKVSSQYPLLAEIALSRESLKRNYKNVIDYVLRHGGEVEEDESSRVFGIKKQSFEFWNGERMCREVDVKVFYWDILQMISEEEGNFRKYKSNNNDWYSQFE